MAPTTRAARSRLNTDALLVRKAPFGEADAMVTFFTEARGVVSAVARSAQRSSRRFPALEPMHLLRIALDERSGADIGVLVEATVARPRLGLASDLDKLEAAGRALRWVRQAAPPHTPEPALWRDVNALLDELDTPGHAALPVARVAAMGLRMLVSVGWGLELERCVRCGQTCDPNATALVDAAEGGLVCRACGGARTLLRPSRRARMLEAIRGDDTALDVEDASVAITLVDATLAAHTG